MRVDDDIFPWVDFCLIALYRRKAFVFPMIEGMLFSIPME